MAKHDVSAELADDGFLVSLTRSGVFGLGRKLVPVEDWSPELHPVVGFLRLLLENDAAVGHADGVSVSHETIACMPPSETALLGLPRHCPYSLQLAAVGAISESGFSVKTIWIDGTSGEVGGLKRTGTLLENVAERFLVGEPLFGLLSAVDSLNHLGSAPISPATLDARMVQFDRLKLALRLVTGDVRADQYLDKLTIHHATGLAIEPREGAADLFQPILFGDKPNPAASPENEEAVTERQALLPSDHALKFRTVLFPHQGARSHYRLADGVYAVVDAPVVAAMRVVERVNGSGAATRAAFRANPRSFLVEEIEKAGGSGDILCDSPIVREPMEYGERVLGVRQWDGIKLSFSVPVYHNWFPQEGEDIETYTIDVPGASCPLVVRRDQVVDLRTEMERARAAGSETVQFKGASFPLTPEVEQAVSGLAGQVTPPPTPTDKSSQPDLKVPGKLLVLRAAENEEDLLYNSQLRDPAGTLAKTYADADLRTPPMPHQVEGITWLRNCFLSGMPGVLLADDMGLGKTFQVLAFLHWLRANEQGDRRPILVVAPKKLLGVWREEILTHLGSTGLGTPVLAYDEHLRGLKVETGKDGQLGRHTLDVAQLRGADWVLTTYETLRDYHFSFGAVRFRVGIYDEAQKMKSMASLVNNAAKCQQPDFTILMTGTPIENTVMDLWTLLDVAWPGFLRMSGKEFNNTYGKEPSAEILTQLKARLIEPTVIGDRECPPVLLRRFKSTTLTGLPKKSEIPWREVMSAEQVKVYDAVVADQQARRMPALQALQALRAAAFHPELRMPGSTKDHEHLIQVSARFRALFKILDQAFKAGERVLVFVDLHRAQTLLVELIRSRYGLKDHPRIVNGDTATKALDVIKAEFQAGRGFAVLLLGPRSAGFGLTLTAANHVVHLNRWWNPAVEDQCSDRVYRLGQDKDVSIHIPIAIHPGLKEGSFDVVLHDMLTRKRALSAEIVVPTVMTDGDRDEMYSKLLGGSPSARGSLARLDTMGWKEFEDWTADQFVEAGYQHHSTPKSGDKGADIILRPPPRSVARGVICQCKHRSLGEGVVDEGAVEDVLRARPVYGAKYGWLLDPVLVAVTNGSFTPAALRTAKAKGVLTVDRANVDDLARFSSRLLSENLATTA